MRMAKSGRRFRWRGASDPARWCVAAAMVLLAGSAVEAQLVTVAFDDFEGLTLQPFDVANDVGVGDGTDWTKDIRTGTGREWTIDNSQMGNPAGSAAGGVCAELAYNGWSAMDVDSWVEEQGPQIGRTTLGAGTHNTALVADPDAYYDFDDPTQPGDAYNSYISRDYDLAGRNEATLEITFDWEFAIENNQRGLVDVSFDGGVTWQNLIDVDNADGVNDTILTGPSTFVAGTDFVATSESLRLRIGCVEAGNNWWFAVDNIEVTTADGFLDFEDFEGLELGPFGVAAGSPPGDGTDWTGKIANWTVDNSAMLGFSLEGAYDGWAVLDSDSWVNEQGGQGRTDLSTFGTHNSVLVADGDAFYDYGRNLDDTGPAPAQAVNTWVSRTYDLSDYDNCTLQITFDYEFVVENQQRGLAQVSFDGGTTWTTLLDLDNNDGANDTKFTGFTPFVAGVDFTATQSSSMILRFGYVNADNNWWFAVDNVRVEAEELTFVPGDANGDGFFDFGDIEAFVLALLDPKAYANDFPTVDPNVVLDFFCDGVFDFGDIEGFVYALLNG